MIFRRNIIPVWSAVAALLVNGILTVTHRHDHGPQANADPRGEQLVLSCGCPDHGPVAYEESSPCCPGHGEHSDDCHVCRILAQPCSPIAWDLDSDPSDLVVQWAPKVSPVRPQPMPTAYHSRGPPAISLG